MISAVRKIMLASIAAVLLSSFKMADEEVVIARFGKHKITLDEFKIAYLDIIKKPNVFDSKELREDFLDELIASRLLAEEGIKAGLNQDELLQYKYSSYRNKVLRDAHFEKIIKPKVVVSELDVEEAYRFTQEERKVSHLFAETKEKADSLYSRLLRGESFEQLAKETFKDSLLAANGGDIGWVYWDQLDYDFGAAAFKQIPNEPGKPVKSPFGYHIIKVTDYKKNPLITRREYEVHRRKAKYLLEYKLGEKYAYEYIESMLKNAKVILFTDVYSFVADKLANKFKRKPTDADRMFETQLRDEEIKYVESTLWDERDKVIAEVNGRKFTVGEFIGILNYIRYDIIYSSFKKTFDYAIRDFLITREAEAMGLDKNEQVRMKSELYQEFIISLELRKKIVSATKVSEEEVRRLYDEKADKFNGATFGQMKEVLEKFALSSKRRNAVPEYLKSILAGMKVEKNMKPVHDYYDAILKGEIK